MSFFTTSPATGKTSNFSTPQLNFSAPQFLVLCPLCICEQLLSGARNKGIGDRLTQQNFWPPARHHHHLASRLGLAIAIAKPTAAETRPGLRYRYRFRLNRIEQTNSSPSAGPTSLLLLATAIAADAPLTSPPPRQLATWLSRRSFRQRLLALPEVRRDAAPVVGFFFCFSALFLFVGRGCRCKKIGPGQ